MLRISFDFNETSKSITNLSVIDLANNKTRGIVSSSSPNNLDESCPDLIVLDNKLQLSKSAIVKLGAKSDDRISIQYINEGIGKATPVIAKAEVFTDRLDGNRLTQKGTVAFRGEKRSTLLEFGSEFNFEAYKDNIWKLIPFVADNDAEKFSEELSDAEALNDVDIDQEIQLLSPDDDLPF